MPRTRSVLNHSDLERHENARLAITNARKLLPGWRATARMLSRNPQMKVELTAGQTSCTDGKTVIYIRVPFELSDMPEHDRSVCGDRGEDNILLCGACDVLEDVNITVIHEVCHIVFDTFEEMTEYERSRIVDQVVKLHAEGAPPNSRMAKLKRSLDECRQQGVNDYLSLSQTISPFLPIIINACEDIRVNARMQEERPGTRIMFDAQTTKVFRDGIKDYDGSIKSWREAPPNAQAIIGLYCKAGGFAYENAISPEIYEKLDDQTLDDLCSQVTTAKSMRKIYTLSLPMLERLRQLGFCLDPDDPEDEPQPEPEMPSGQQEENSDEDNQAGSDDNGSSSESDGEADDTEPTEGEDECDGSSGNDDGEEDDGSSDSSDSDGDDESSGGEADPDSDNEGDDGSSVSEDQDEGDGADTSDESESGSDDSEVDSAESTSEPSSSESGSDGESEESDVSDGDGRSEDQGDDGSSDHQDDDDSTGPESQESGDSDSDSQGDAGEQSSGSAMEEQESGLEPSEDDASDEGQDATTPDAAPSPGDGTGDVDHGATEATDSSDSSDKESPEPYTQADQQADGTPEDVEHLFGIFGRHEEQEASPSEAIEESDNEEALRIALDQIDFFDSPSLRIGGVTEYKYEDRQAAWQKETHRPPIEVGEGILTSSLMRLRLLFTDNARGRTERNRRTGKVDGRVLAKRAPAGDDRLFKKRTVPGRRDYFVLIGLDCSGSTAAWIHTADKHGRNVRLDMMKAAAGAKAELLSRLGIPFAMYAHSGDFDAVAIFEIKGPKEPWGKKQRESLDALNPYSGNLDGHTLEYYRKVVERRPETDRLLLYYTDGAMPASNYDEELEILQREIKTCERLGVHLVGIGVNSDAPTEHGLDTIRLDDVSDIPDVINELRKRLM